MMRLELSDKEGKVLADVLESSLNRLKDEISHTDTREYREFLKDRKKVLLKLCEKVH